MRLELTEDQMVKLEPVMGTGLRSIIGLVLENADKRMTPPRKMSLGRSMKSIQSDMDKQIAGILTDEQWAKYQAMKESEGQPPIAMPVIVAMMTMPMRWPASRAGRYSRTMIA